MFSVQLIKVHKVPELEYLTVGETYEVLVHEDRIWLNFRNERRNCGTFLRKDAVANLIARGDFEVVESN